MTHHKAVLWDMDGTIVDTEPYWMECETELALSYGLAWTHQDAMKQVGNDMLVTGRYMRDFGVPLEPEAIVDLLTDNVAKKVRGRIPWRAGARELLEDLNARGVPCALVTMSYRVFAEAILDQLPEGTFAAVVTGDQVEHGKPHPEPYLTGAAALGLPAAECIAIEDSDTGATSAADAGCTVLCIPNHVEIQPGPSRVFADSVPFTWDALRTLVQ